MLNDALDATDWKILGLLQEDARISNVDLAQAVGLSPSPCLSRVRALEQRGFIRRYVTLLDPQRVGMKVSVFIQVTLEKQIEPALEVFEKAIRARPEVMECYLMTGEADYLLRVVVPDLQALEHFILALPVESAGGGEHQVELRAQAGEVPDRGAAARAGGEVTRASGRRAAALTWVSQCLRRTTAPTRPRPRRTSTQVPASGTGTMPTR